MTSALPRWAQQAITDLQSATPTTVGDVIAGIGSQLPPAVPVAVMEHLLNATPVADRSAVVALATAWQSAVLPTAASPVNAAGVGAPEQSHLRWTILSWAVRLGPIPQELIKDAIRDAILTNVAGSDRACVAIDLVRANVAALCISPSPKRLTKFACGTLADLMTNTTAAMDSWMSENDRPTANAVLLAVCAELATTIEAHNLPVDTIKYISMSAHLARIASSADAAEEDKKALLMFATKVWPVVLADLVDYVLQPNFQGQIINVFDAMGVLAVPAFEEVYSTRAISLLATDTRHPDLLDRSVPLARRLLNELLRTADAAHIPPAIEEFKQRQELREAKVQAQQIAEALGDHAQRPTQMLRM